MKQQYQKKIGATTTLPASLQHKHGAFYFQEPNIFHCYYGNYALTITMLPILMLLVDSMTIPKQPNPHHASL